MRGFTLVEMAVAGAGFALVAMVAAAMISGGQVAQQQRQASAALGKAEDALLGYALVHHRLPAPTSGLTAVAGYSDGTLPVADLGMAGPVLMLYRVGASLAAPPLPTFNPDPEGRLGSQVGLPATPNGLDLCARLIQSLPTPAPAGAASASAPAAGSSPATAPTVYALLAVDSVPASTPSALDADMKLPTGTVAIETRQRGVPELVDRLGCLPAMNRVISQAHEAALLHDAAQVAALMGTARQLYADRSDWALANQIWRGLNRVLQLVQQIANITLLVSTAAATETSALSLRLTIAGHVASMVGTTDVIARAAAGMPGVLATREKSKADSLAHEPYVSEQQRRATDAVANVGALQQKGLEP